MTSRRGRPREVEQDVELWAYVRYWQGNTHGGVRRSVAQVLKLLAQHMSREPGRIQTPSVATLRARFNRAEKRSRDDPEFLRRLFSAYHRLTIARMRRHIEEMQQPKPFTEFPNN